MVTEVEIPDKWLKKQLSYVIPYWKRLQVVSNAKIKFITFRCKGTSFNGKIIFFGMNSSHIKWLKNDNAVGIFMPEVKRETLKLSCLTGIYWSLDVQECFNSEYDFPINNKPLDFFFCGSTQKNQNRKQVLELNIPNSFIHLGNHKTASDMLPFQKYIEKFAQSKIALSLPGHKNISARDYHAIIYGCRIIRPSLDGWHTYPDVLYEPNAFVQCRNDLTDVPQLVKQILYNWEEHKQIALNLRRKLLKYTVEQYALKVEQQVIKWLTL